MTFPDELFYCIFQGDALIRVVALVPMILTIFGGVWWLDRLGFSFWRVY